MGSINPSNEFLWPGLIDLDDLVARLYFMDNYSVTAFVHAGLLGFAQHSKWHPLLTLP